MAKNNKLQTVRLSQILKEIKKPKLNKMLKIFKEKNFLSIKTLIGVTLINCLLQPLKNIINLN